MENLNITKGKASVITDGNGFVFVTTELSDICRLEWDAISGIPQSNAELIAESFNVANETGLTPRELLNQRNELLEACKEIQKAIGVLPHNWHWTVKDAMPKVITAIANTTK